MAVLEAITVSKLYPKRRGLLQRWSGAIRAVDQVSCAIEPGDAVGLVGESGCGKTTLAKLLMGLLTPSDGEVRVHGVPLGRLRGGALKASKRVVQCIFQDPLNSLNPRMTVEEILSEPLLIHRLASGGARRKQIEQLLETVGLPAAYSRRLPRELSGGERQRVGIARALALEPEALICDEPIASLDLSVGVRILELLRAIRRERRMALLFISHDLRAVAWLCERIAVMREGRLLDVAPTEELIRHPRHPYTQLLIRAAQLDLDASP